MWYALGTLSRWLVFAGLLTSFGAIVFRVAILPRVSPGLAPPKDSDGFDPSRASARAGLLGIRLLLLGAIGRLAAQMAVFRDPFAPLLEELQLLLVATTWGKAWIGQVGFALVALIAFAFAARARGRPASAGWGLATAAVVLLQYTPAFSGHAIGSEHLTMGAITADIFHVMAGGAWLGSLAVIAVVVAGARKHGDPIGRVRLSGWIEAFSPIALVSAALVGATGLFGAWLHLGGISSLWTSSYGQRLSLKLAILSIVLGCGAYNWKRSQGRVSASGHSPRLPPTVSIELAAGILILLITAVLVTTPLPVH